MDDVHGPPHHRVRYAARGSEASRHLQQEFPRNDLIRAKVTGYKTINGPLAAFHRCHRSHIPCVPKKCALEMVTVDPIDLAAAQDLDGLPPDAESPYVAGPASRALPVRAPRRRLFLDDGRHTPSSARSATRHCAIEASAMAAKRVYDRRAHHGRVGPSRSDGFGWRSISARESATAVIARS